MKKDKAFLVYKKSNSFGDLEVCLLVNTGGQLLNMYFEAVEGQWGSLEKRLESFEIVQDETELL